MNLKLQVDRYLEYSLNFNDKEKAFLKNNATWYPKRIIDCHAHCNLLEHVGKLPQKSLTSMISTFFYYTVPFSKKINNLLYPNSVVRTLRFPNVFPGIKLKRANKYLLSQSAPYDGVAVFGSADDCEYVIQMLRKHKPNALKMYWYYTEKSAETIYQCFPEKVLKVAQEMDIPIILHLPKVITKSKDDLLSVLLEYPKLRICVPHLGSTKFVIDGLEETYKILAKKTNIFLDTSLNPSYEVIKLAFKYFGTNRIMFGSDQPLNLIRYVPYVNPEKGQRILTEFIYHWVDEDEHDKYKYIINDLYHCHWLAVNSLRKVIDEYPIKIRDKIKEDVFYNNAKKFYKFR